MQPTKLWLGLLHVPDFGRSKGKDEPNFKNYNQAYYDLYDDEKLSELVSVKA